MNDGWEEFKAQDIFFTLGNPKEVVKLFSNMGLSFSRHILLLGPRKVIISINPGCPMIYSQWPERSELSLPLHFDCPPTFYHHTQKCSKIPVVFRKMGSGHSLIRLTCTGN